MHINEACDYNRKIVWKADCFIPTVDFVIDVTQIKNQTLFFAILDNRVDEWL